MRFVKFYEAALEYFGITSSGFTAVFFFVLTGLLILLIHRHKRLAFAELTAWASVASIAAAIYFMVAAWYEIADIPALTMPSRTVISDGRAGQSVKDCPECPELVVLPSGYFDMGAVDALAGREEGPSRRIMVPRNIAIGRAAVTPAEFTAFTKATGLPLKACGSVAAGCIDRGSAEAYVAWLSWRTGKAYRLPSAAEWEYAGRAGAPQPSGGVMALAVSAPAASTGEANGFGVSGMAEGRTEMVADCWTPTLATVASNGMATTPPAGRRCGLFVAKIGVPAGYGGNVRVRYSGRQPITAADQGSRLTFRVVRDLPMARL